MAWRSLFWIGVLPAFLVLYIRKHVPEPEVFQRNLARQKDAAQRTSFWAIFSPALLKTTVVTSLLCTAVQGGYYAITTWLPTFLKTERNLSVLNTGGYLLVIILGLVLRLYRRRLSGRPPGPARQPADLLGAVRPPASTCTRRCR